MPRINKKISNIDKLSIYVKTAFELFRGGIKGVGIKKRFPIFIGRKVEITHKKNIYCGKNVKFESYSEIHGLATNDLKSENDVTTISKIFLLYNTHLYININYKEGKNILWKNII
ncbi:hypothetical protein [Ligilactobacillus salivarius]|uniref:hypothetical protein n=1 Tax=Ligilactobacillus salivarius TaxID=1624 RepID=UPI003F21F092